MQFVPCEKGSASEDISGLSSKLDDLEKSLDEDEDDDLDLDKVD
jgi:hypothetical protein